MHIYALVWHPNARWDALDQAKKLSYLKSLDAYINSGRAAGAIVLGWSKIDQTLPKAPKEGFVGVFGLSSAEQVHEFEKIVQQADWYTYFDNTNISIDLIGATEPEPHKIYAQLLDVPT
ncbi:MAG: DUF6616 family protein [Gammaproteobacteria bacterium]|jgi:hypothetical protein